MTNVKMALALVASVLVADTEARADNTGGQFAVEGAGTLTCATFIEARADRGSAEYQRFIGFIEGYVSAANRYEPDTFDLTPWHNAAAFDLIFDNHCSDHPDDTVVSVVQRMVGALRPVRITDYSPMVEVGNGSNKAIVYRATLQRSQAALREAALYDGPEDGAYSPQLRDALLAFQKDKSLVATGVPDPATLWTLLNP